MQIGIIIIFRSWFPKRSLNEMSDFFAIELIKLTLSEMDWINKSLGKLHHTPMSILVGARANITNL